MSRIRLLDAAQAPLLARPLYQRGDPGPIVAALAQVPELLEVTLPFVNLVLGPTAIGARTKELVILRTSALLGCRFCVQSHTAVARDAGLSVAEVRALRAAGPAVRAAGLPDAAEVLTDPAERALLAWVDAVALGPGPVPEPARAALAPFFADHEVVELTLVTGATLLLNRFCTALDLPTSAAVLARLADEDLL
jgi:AhpD family alkylhydroperoxidase